ncbi:efflux RND transporter permease subunit [Rhodospirillaceae bacterium SYSU D60014]|uniref:efflux RND transporter permease subunit n=1 Tax=Virgifigura deserti TaxID=2268457 RepID=UPI000E67617B
MGFTELFIRRPVLSTVVSLLILLLGAQGMMNMSVRQYPEVDETVITVTTAYPGASANLMQGFITTPVAKAVASAEGVDYVTSKSMLGTSTVSVHMRLNTDPDKALTEVIAKTQQVRGELPEDAEDPIVQKGTGQSFALMYLAFTNDRMTPQQVTEYLTRVIQPRLSTVDGVADAQVLGGQTFAMRVWIDPIKLASRGVTAAEVAAAIRGSNFLAAPGKTKNDLVAYAVETETTLQTPESFGALPIRADGDDVVRLRDVARVELGSENYEVKVSFNGEDGTFIGIFPTPAANPLDMAQAVRDILPSIQDSLPEGMNVRIVYDASTFIQASIEEVFKTIGEAVLIVVLVILLFLGSFRSVVIPIVTIPLSLIGVCFFLYLLGYSLNTLTLLAMVLAIGLVVDDAIVVVENIHRHLEEGLKPIPAAIKGMKEITGPVIAMTVTLAAVYAPIGFAQGLTGSLFKEFAFTLAGAVVISGIVALTLSPMMSSRLLNAHGEHGGSRFQRIVDRSFDRLGNWYGRRLTGSLNYRSITLFVVVALLGTMGYLFLKTSSELAPEEDQGALFAMVQAPPYATSEYTTLFMNEFAAINDRLPERDASFTISGMDGGASGIAVWTFKPWGERERSQQEMQQQIQAELGQVAGVQSFVFAPPSLPGSGGGMPIQYVIQSTSSPERVYEVAETIRQKAQATGRFIMVQNSLSYESPRARVIVDRDRAAALGVAISEIGTTLNVLLGESWVSKFDRDDRSYDIIPQAEQEYRLNPESLGRYYVRSASGDMVPLSAVVHIETGAAPAAIEQFNQLNAATLSAIPMPGVTSAEGLQVLRDVAQETMPSGFFEDFAGESRLTIQEGSSIALAFGLAVIVIYLVLAAQFESFRDPFIIMMSVPLSIFGALIPLNLGLATLNIYTQVGLITLVGLITKHGILMVEFANGLRAQGMSRRQAIEEAARVRLRPILMTTAAMVLGVSPLLIANGAGAAARFSIGLVIAAGLAIGTLFTLFVVPMFYSFVAKPDPSEKDVPSALPDTV